MLDVAIARPAQYKSLCRGKYGCAVTCWRLPPTAAAAAVACVCISRRPELLLAVLQPAKLVVYSCHAVGVAYLQLDKVFEHQLEAPAANMALGPFGSATGGRLHCRQFSAVPFGVGLGSCKLLANYLDTGICGCSVCVPQAQQDIGRPPE